MTSAVQLEDIARSFGTINAVKNVNLGVEEGEFFTFLGPSGSGKSTVLRMIAGLEHPDRGRIVIAGRDVTTIPPWKRDIGMVFQQYALFPHMDVAQNIGYGMKMRGAPRDEIDRTVDRLVELVGLAGYRKRRVSRLSGGEQQRVALARGLAARPAVLLLDEPLGALDEKVRREMQRELKRIHIETGTTFVYVTHDQEEALTMSDRIAVFQSGSVAQCDRPEAIFQRPRNRFVASFFRGFNVLEARVTKVTAGAVSVELGGEDFDVPRDDRVVHESGSSTALGIRGERMIIGPGAVNHPVVLDGALVDVVYKGTNIDHVVELRDGQTVTVTSVRREVTELGPTLVGCNPEDVVLLED